MDVCRLCLSEGPGFAPIYGAKNQVQKLVFQLLELMNFQLPEVEYWPTQICSQCIGGVANVINFCEKVKQTQLTISARYGDLPVESFTSTTDTAHQVDMVLADDDTTVFEIKYLNEQEMEDHQAGEEEDRDGDVLGENEIEDGDLIVEIKPAKRTAAKGKRKYVKRSPAKRAAKEHNETEEVDEIIVAQDESGSDEGPSRRKSRRSAGEDPEEGDADSPKRSKVMNDMLRQYGLLVCQKCPIPHEFKDFRTMRAHNMEVHTVDGIECCNRIFKARARCFEHVRYHIKPDAVKCEKCPKTFVTQSVLKLHMKTQHTDQTFHCPFPACEYKFALERQLKRHELTHIPMGERSFACYLCESKFNYLSALTFHIKTRHSEQGAKVPHICEVCGKHFSTKGNLTNHHVSFHDPEAKKAVCTQCGKAVRRLSRHLAICQKNLALKCPHCENVHPNMHALRTHIQRIHKQDKSKLTCEVCGKVLSRETHLKEHMATHTGTPLYNCQFCGKEFFSNSNMYKHLRLKHFDEYNELKATNKSITTKIEQDS